MEPIKRFFRKARYSYRSLPGKKQYVEFFTAVLTVPVLLTVIILNLNNLRNSNKTTQPTPTPVVSQDHPIIVTFPPSNSSSGNSSQTSPTPTPTTLTPTPQACVKGIGPISIDSPEDNETVTDNPVQVDINYQQGDYCAVVWAYSINGGKFSDFDDKSIALYNPPQGTIQFQLKVKSIVTGEQKILTRTFVYQGSQSTASSSAH
ncbi:MAG TPA: hypothetical protein VG935_02140 [Patescibacteria group bacterium]|nr:hypothetical protein [Patescibacteria group bacterium]